MYASISRAHKVVNNVFPYEFSSQEFTLLKVPTMLLSLIIALKLYNYFLLKTSYNNSFL